MDFGHATEDQLAELDLHLPDDHAASWTLQGHTSEAMTIRVGCGKWGIPAWVGPLYPEGTREKDYLAEYLKRFSSIELNATFYRLSRSSIEKWAAMAQGHDFHFCPKWSQRISHLKRLNEVEEGIDFFVTTVAGLGPSLGHSFLTLPPNFSAKYFDRVQKWAEQLPVAYPVALELRHESWFEEPVFSETMSLLHERQLTAAITDVALRRDALHMCLTDSTAFVRFNGYGLHPSDYHRLDEWVLRLIKWRDQGVQQVYFFMHQADESHTIRLVSYFSKKIQEQLDAHFIPLTLEIS